MDAEKLKQEILRRIIKSEVISSSISSILELAIYRAVAEVSNTIPIVYEFNCTGGIDVKETIANICDNFKLERVPVFVQDKTEYIYINEDFALFQNDLFSTKEIDFSNYKVKFKPKPTIYYVINGHFGLEARALSLTFYDNIYVNSDFDREKVERFINSDRSGLILFNGDPGTGKTSIIKDFISKSSGRTFLYMNTKLLADITSSDFISFLEGHKDAVIVFEDCEEILASRNTNYNPLISTVLNLSDGMLGENFKIKFICTLNAPDTNIDSALLRKGRLFYKYEFKALDKEVVAKVFKDFNIEAEPKSMTLAEAINYSIDNNTNTKTTRRKVGF